MEIFGLEVERLTHACVRVRGSKTIYFDPYNIDTDVKADIILITHEHYDHCSPEDIEKIIKEDTIIIASHQCKEKLKQFEGRVKEIRFLKPFEKTNVDNVEIEGFPAYNVNKPFHPKEDEKLGYVVTLDGKRLYHAGDTDVIPEMNGLENIDIAFLPVSGTYVMTAEEAVEAAKMIRPKVAIPIHYGAIVGTEKDAEKFKEFLGGSCEVYIL